MIFLMYMEINFPKLEKKILKFWKENSIFEKSIERRKRAKNFVFYEGPPTANAKPGVHHVLSRVFKDIIPRYKTMRGFRVLRKAGWDTHGLPVELQIEKKLGLKSKKDIEKYGIAKFNKKCKESVWEYKKDWEKLTERIGYWLDLKNPYITYETDYIESVWWLLKEIYKKGLLYQDFKVVPYCPRCGTSLSSHEVAQGYKRIKEPAIYIKFKILNPEFKNTSLLVWTTTPWTLPGNVAIAINENFVYSQIKTQNEYLILAKGRLDILNSGYEVLKEFKGKELVGLRYQPLFDFYRPDYKKERIYEVVGAQFVSLEEGTGLVHIAPAFGEEDSELIKIQNEKCKIQNLPEFPILLTVDEEGKFKLEVKKWARMFVKEADPLIIEDLKNRDLLFKEEIYEHDYPFCWRCKTPLLYYAKKSWFIKMTKVKKDLIKNNQKINWIPSHLKKGRFGEWLREIKDWALSRERYWGTPLPIWQCKECGNLEVIGSQADFQKQKFSQNTYFILRHGETIYQTDLKKLTYPTSNPKLEIPPIGLTKKGKEEIKTLSQKIKKLKVDASTGSASTLSDSRRVDLIFSSDFQRTKETAEIIAKELGLKIIFDKRLRDVNLGIFQGKPKEELFQSFPEPRIKERFYKKLKNGESWLDVRKRMLKFIREIDEKYKGKKILIVSHGDPLWLLEGITKGLSDDQLIKEKIQRKTIKTGELKKIKLTRFPLNESGEIDFHRPYIDEIEFFCQKCSEGLMERVPEVIDCWFDSGSMPFAQYHYPFENKKLIEKKIQFPADYIAEAIDQTRGWFYTLLAISTLLKKGPSYKNVISLGHVLDEKGEKMSKSKGNVVDPWYIIEKYGVDATRWYFYTVNQPGDSKLFSEKDVEESLRKFILTLWNCFTFFKTYAEKIRVNQRGYQRKSASTLLDRWIISKLSGLILNTTNYLEKYNITSAAREIENFVINDLSLWYIRRSRKRFQNPETKKELEDASQVLRFVLLTLSKLTSPFIPFLSEEIYQKVTVDVRRQHSVHLTDWPSANEKLIDKKLNKKIEKVREIVALALAQRAKFGIKVRQPLNELKIKKYELNKEKELLDLIKDEINVKKIVSDSKIKKEVELDSKITPELKEEGIIREVIRNIQEMRKQARLKPKDKIAARCFGGPELNEILTKNKPIIMREGKIKDFQVKKDEKKVFDIKKETMVDQEKLWLAIKKI